MARKDLVKHKFPVSYEAELLEILEDIGLIEDTTYLADRFGVSRQSIMGFLQTDRAKQAASLATPATRAAWLRNAVSTSSEAEDQALPDEADLIENGLTIQELYPDDLVYPEEREE